MAPARKGSAGCSVTIRRAFGDGQGDGWDRGLFLWCAWAFLYFQLTINGRTRSIVVAAVTELLLCALWA